MSTTIANAFGFELPEDTPVKGSGALYDDNVLIGIEHEFEGWRSDVHAGNTPSQYFTERDGSLRNGGMEYILSSPLKGGELNDALLSMSDMYDGSDLIINERTSTHVHVDVRDLTILQYRNFILAYIILEDILFGLCSEERIGNPYCVALGQSRHMENTFRNLQRGATRGDMFSEGLRYGAISMNATQRMGSLEFRMRETIPVYNDILQWVNILLGMRDFAVNKCSLDYMSFIEKLHSKDPQLVLKYMLGENNTKYIVSKLPDLEQRLSTGADAIFNYIRN